MPDQLDQCPELPLYAEMRNLCSILERISQQYPDQSPESHALAEAARALVLVYQHKALTDEYLKLKAASNGRLSEDQKARLKAVGIDIESLEELVPSERIELA